ncbi:hypothetical protein LNTAR_15407 [Lentisphaera araneosa HTCC2155]|uniref:Uncharacterized protein n=1 Tax=Lentisphaera araneosa HTCC2155 TaxID=313628 RepID=A6DU66_9BACT|nr:hypothetical protein LNTAR_15407 [Lentisphaera araneosa HTCC2155]
MSPFFMLDQNPQNLDQNPILTTLPKSIQSTKKPQH